MSDVSALQRQWYRALADQGFTDLEGADGALAVAAGRPLSLRCGDEPTSLEVDALAEYYSRASAFVHEYPFHDDVERGIWSLHAEGASYTRISRRVGCYRRRVHATVTRLRAVMLGLRSRPRGGRPREAGALRRNRFNVALSDAHLRALEYVAGTLAMTAAEALRLLVIEAEKRLRRAP